MDYPNCERMLVHVIVESAKKGRKRERRCEKGQAGPSPKQIRISLLGVVSTSLLAELKNLFQLVRRAISCFKTLLRRLRRRREEGKRHEEIPFNCQTKIRAKDEEESERTCKSLISPIM